MGIYRNEDTVKFGIKQFCNFFDCDIEYEYHKDEWGDEFLYKITERTEDGFKRYFRIKAMPDIIGIFSEVIEERIEAPLWFKGFDKVFDKDKDDSFYKQAKDWIDKNRPDLQDSDAYGVLCAIIDANVLRNDIGLPVFVRRAYGSFAPVSDTCYTIEQAFYLANKRWKETKDKSYWFYYYVSDGNTVLKDYKKD